MKELALHILDIMQNSIAAQASLIKVVIMAKSETGILETVVEDNGCGMDSDLLNRTTDPFYTTRTTRKVGLGIPLFKASAEQSGGSFGITSQKGAGTVVTAAYLVAHIDRPPLGDLAGVIADTAAAYPAVEIHLLIEGGSGQFVFNSRVVRQTLGEVPLTEYAVVKWLREYIEEGIKDILGGVLGEIDS